MRIERLEIGGFGRFANVAWDLEPGLTVMLGENEAGKSTLLNAVRAILFGFESSRDGRAWYPALAGGRRGGRMTLLTAAGERWSVERYGPRGGAGSLAVRAPSGNQGGQETLDRLLHGADRDLFNAIFAFGLGELSDFGTLGGDGVRGRIYGAAAGLGGTSAVDLERRLRQDQEDLFRPTGRLQPLNRLFTRMDELRARIVELTRQPEEFEAAHRERAEALAAATRERAAAQDIRARALRLRRLLEAAPVVARLDELEAELAATDPALDALPADAIAVLDGRLAALAHARERLDALDEQLAEITAQLAGLAVDERVLEAADEIRALDADRRSHAAGDDRLREATAAEARHAAAVAEQLARAGVPEESRLVALDDSIPAVEATRDHERSLAQAREGLTMAERRHASASDELAAREREGLPDAEDLGGEADARAALRRVERLRSGGAAGGVVLHQPGVAAGLAMVTFIVAVALGFGVQQPLAGAVVGVILGAALAGILVLGRDRVTGAADEATLLATAGLAPGASDEDIARRADELAVASARRSLIRGEAANLESRRDEVRRLDQARDAARSALEAAEEAWSAWLRERDLPAGSSPEVARQVLSAAGAARRAAVERDAQRGVVATIEGERSAFEQRAFSLLERLGVDDGGSVDGRLTSLVQRLERSATDRRTAQEAEARRAQLLERRAPVVASVDARAAAVAEHLAATGCTDTVELRSRDAAAALRRSLQQRLRETRAELGGFAGGREAIDALRTELRERDLASVEAELASADAEAESHDAEERRLVSRIGELDARIRTLEAADELGTLRQELTSVEGRAQAIATEWAVKAITARLLSETRSRYERERQPDVLRAATSHFERITAGRYARIVAPPGDATIRVESEGGESRSTEELSRGTAEQLYLAMRFGLIEEFARHAEPLPVVMDDIVVNFDTDRAARAAASIRELAARHQVLYFTCHPWTAELLDPDGARTIRLG